MYTLYKFHFLNGISEINQLFDDILIIWPAPVYVSTFVSQFEFKNKMQKYIYIGKIILEIYSLATIQLKSMKIKKIKQNILI